MTLISTPTLRKITTLTILVAIITFGAAEIHKRLTPTPILPLTSAETSSSPSQVKPEITTITGTAAEIDEEKITITKDGKKGVYHFSPEVRVFPVYSGEGGEMQISLADIQAGQPVQAKLIQKEKGKEIYLVKDLFVFF